MKVNLGDSEVVVTPQKEKSFDLRRFPKAVSEAGFSAGRDLKTAQISATVRGTAEKSLFKVPGYDPGFVLENPEAVAGKPGPVEISGPVRVEGLTAPPRIQVRAAR